MLADSPAQDRMRQRIAGRTHLVTGEGKVMRMLCSIYGIEHNGKVTAGRIFHTTCYIKTTDGQTMVLVFYRTCTDGNVGEQVFNIRPVLRVEHLVCTGKTAFCDSAQVHFTHGDQTLDHIRCLGRIRLGSNALVTGTGGPRFIGIDTRNDEHTVFDLFLYGGQAVDILTDRIFVVCGAWSDDGEHAVIFSCNDICDLLISVSL